MPERVRVGLVVVARGWPAARPVPGRAAQSRARTGGRASGKRCVRHAVRWGESGTPASCSFCSHAAAWLRSVSASLGRPLTGPGSARPAPAPHTGRSRRVSACRFCCHRFTSLDSPFVPPRSCGRGTKTVPAAILLVGQSREPCVLCLARSSLPPGTRADETARAAGLDLDDRRPAARARRALAVADDDVLHQEAALLARAAPPRRTRRLSPRWAAAHPGSPATARRPRRLIAC